MNLARLAVTAAGAGQASAHRAFCRKVRAEFPVGGRAVGHPPEFREVVAIVASSRGGSSMLFDMLRSTGAFACLEGEHSTLYKLYGLGLPADPAAHDGTVPAGADLDGFLSALAEDVSAGPAVLPLDAPAADVRLFASRAVRMLAQQWPGCPLAPGEVWEVVHAIIARRGPACGYHPTRILMPVLRELRARGWPIDPWYFDISPETITARFPGVPSPHGPPGGLAQTLEAPPFLVPSPAVPPGDRGSLPLLLKASMDAYRIPLLRELFPDARLRLIHLIRNPAAAINGLIDGWLHHGFFPTTSATGPLLTSAATPNEVTGPDHGGTSIFRLAGGRSRARRWPLSARLSG